MQKGYEIGICYSRYRFLRQRTELKTLYKPGCYVQYKISLDLEEEKELWDAIGMLRIISERTSEIDEELRVCFKDWQKAFDRVNWTKLIQILKGTGIDWRERRLISNLYMAQSFKV